MPGPPPASGRGMRVLLVEDDADLRELYGLVLVRAGNQVDVARDGAEAIEQLAGGAHDMLLLDIRLPGVDGFGVLEWMRGVGLTTPTLVLSNFSDRHLQERAHDLGAAAWIVKSQLRISELPGIMASVARPAPERPDVSSARAGACPRRQL